MKSTHCTVSIIWSQEPISEVPVCHILTTRHIVGHGKCQNVPKIVVLDFGTFIYFEYFAHIGNTSISALILGIMLDQDAMNVAFQTHIGNILGNMSYWSKTGNIFLISFLALEQDFKYFYLWTDFRDLLSGPLGNNYLETNIKNKSF